VARDVLLDTGGIVAALDSADQWHQACAAGWETVMGRCLTTEAVVTEACHLVHRGGASAVLPLDFLLATDVPIVGLETGLQRHAAELMRRYADTPMDFADAGLVALGDALGIATVFTTDRRGFRTYRRAGGKAFTLLPAK
jgi:predicted nucleic acid-binding protein